MPKEKIRNKEDVIVVLCSQKGDKTVIRQKKKLRVRLQSKFERLFK